MQSSSLKTMQHSLIFSQRPMFSKQEGLAESTCCGKYFRLWQAPPALKWQSPKEWKCPPCTVNERLLKNVVRTRAPALLSCSVLEIQVICHQLPGSSLLTLTVTQFSLDSKGDLNACWLSPSSALGKKKNPKESQANKIWTKPLCIAFPIVLLFGPFQLY